MQTIQTALKSAGIELPDEMAIQALPQRIQAMQQAAQNANPEVIKELKTLRAADRHYAIKQAFIYQRDFARPTNEKCNGWLNKVVQFLPEEAGRTDFIKQLVAFGGQDGIAPKVDGAYYRKLLDDIAGHGKIDQDSYDVLKNEIPQILDRKQKAIDFATETATNADKFSNWQQKEQQEYITNYQAAHRDETTKVSQTMPKVREYLDKLKPEERAAVDKEYSEVVADYLSGPRAAARRGMEQVRLRIENDELKARVAELEREVPALKQEVQAKRRIAEAPLKPTAGTPASTPAQPPKQSLTESAGRQGLSKALGRRKITSSTGSGKTR